MIKRWLRNWLMNTEDGPMPPDRTLGRNQATVRASESIDDEAKSIRFSVTPARGGVVMTSRTYDPIKDRSSTTVHVIHDDEDVAKNIGHIVSMELLRN